MASTNLHRPSKRRPKRLRSAVIAVSGRYADLVLDGFERDDLDEIRAAVAMSWDQTERVWLLHRRDVDHLTEVLEDLGFLVRVRSIVSEVDE